MPNIVDVSYAQTGESTATNAQGMREMQVRAYSARDNQYLLLKAPPASGKSRALMFLALDKLYKQNIRKAIIAVPERSIGSSFSSKNLSEDGFFSDWVVEPQNNLCTPGGDGRKVQAFIGFMESDDRVIVCTHATLRSAFEAMEEEMFNDCLLAIDEFHHVSADEDSKLGFLLRSVMQKSTAHVVAMTGSYFRGDSVPVLLPEDEAKFTKVTYNYYEQLNGYTHLKSLGIGYHFYQNKYLTAIGDVLDTDKKTIIHIPTPRSGESTQDKYQEVDRIIDTIGTVEFQDSSTGVIHVKRKHDGRIIKVADLVHDDSKARDRIMGYLRDIRTPEDLDIIIALGMAKEGFDWSFCEHALTVGYRGSLTEIIQIIGRCTRDSSNKKHAQFTNLIAQPDAQDDLVKLAVNNMLKAITCSLLMEQVLAPVFKFKTKVSEDDKSGPGEVKIGGFKEPSSKRVKDIIDSDLNDIKARILQDDQIVKALPGGIDPEMINKVMIPKIIRMAYPDLSDDEVEEVRQQVVVDSVVKSSEYKEDGDKRFIKMAGKFINIDDLHIDLIDRINPFQAAFEILSKSVTVGVLKTIKEAIEATRIAMTEEEAVLLWPKIKEFNRVNGRPPNPDSTDPLEVRMGQALIYLRNERRKEGL
ncbi:ATP-dependent helicase [Xanthomonas arboricola pv. arracaciae]|uniref:DEAD/DEAH box helicase n=1 Tax=Xanthomonas arboricola TaxID=56448 RepID=UPI000CEEB12C|nr:DEAD/DEAH box helicase family protein [Xanthomonas arboricola]PPT92433.1 ATP-dependent helicase [Xanthomonas arboricola pv. arracaciae]